MSYFWIVDDNLQREYTSLHHKLLIQDEEYFSVILHNGCNLIYCKKLWIGLEIVRTLSSKEQIKLWIFSLIYTFLTITRCDTSVSLSLLSCKIHLSIRSCTGIRLHGVQNKTVHCMKCANWCSYKGGLWWTALYSVLFVGWKVFYCFQKNINFVNPCNIWGRISFEGYQYSCYPLGSI